MSVAWRAQGMARWVASGGWPTDLGSHFGDSDLVNQLARAYLCFSSPPLLPLHSLRIAFCVVDR